MVLCLAALLDSAAEKQALTCVDVGLRRLGRGAAAWLGTACKEHEQPSVEVAWCIFKGSGIFCVVDSTESCSGTASVVVSVMTSALHLVGGNVWCWNQHR